MSVGYQVEVKGLRELEARLVAYPALFEQEVVPTMSRAVETVASAVRPLVPVHMGILRNSIGTELMREPGAVVGKVGSSLKDEVYPAVMEFGRKPGKMPPPSALERWVELKLHVPEKDVPGVAFLVARKIGRVGIKGTFYLKRGYESTKATVEALWVAANERIANKLAGK